MLPIGRTFHLFSGREPVVERSGATWLVSVFLCLIPSVKRITLLARSLALKK